MERQCGPIHRIHWPALAGRNQSRQPAFPGGSHV